MLPDTKGDTGGIARRSATVCPRDRQHNQRQRHPSGDQAAVVGESRPAAVARRDEGRCGVPAGDAGRRRPTRRRARPRTVRRSPSQAGGTPRHLASAGGDLKGRNGVAVLSRHPIRSVRDLGVDVGAPPASRGGFALHGRYVEVDIDGLTVASVYIQTGEAGTDRQLEKERFMAALAHRMAYGWTDRDAVVCGDWNIAHTENDIKNWRGNVKKSGFLPAERQWLTRLSPSQAGGTPTPRAGSTWFGCCTPTWPGRTRGGHGGGGLSTTTPVGASTTSSRRVGWRRGRVPPGWNGPRPTRCAGPTTRR